MTSQHDRYPLRTVSRLTGLSPDIIRVWERRYQVVEPVRGPRGARLYTKADIDHLCMLSQLVAQGRAIGDVARLDRVALGTLSGQERRPAAAAANIAATSAIVAGILDAVERFHLRDLEVRLGDALLALGAAHFVQDVARPLLEEVGERWAAGTMSVADEHLVSAAMRRILTGLIRLRATDSNAGLLLATPAGEQHELGLMLASLLAVDAGVRVCLLGPNLPAADIVKAATRAGVAAVGLSVVNPDNRAEAIAQVREVERLLPPATELWLGGSDARPLAEELDTTRAILLDRATDLQFHLERLRGSQQAISS